MIVELYFTKNFTIEFYLSKNQYFKAKLIAGAIFATAIAFSVYYAIVFGLYIAR